MMADAKAVKWSAFALIALVACAGAFLLSDSADSSDAASSDGTAVEPTAANLAGAIWTRDSLSDPFMAHVWIHIHEDADISGASASILLVVIVLTLVAIVLWIAVDVLRKRYD